MLPEVWAAARNKRFISLMGFKGEGGKAAGLPGTACLPLKMLMGNANQERKLPGTKHGPSLKPSASRQIRNKLPAI